VFVEIWHVFTSEQFSGVGKPHGAKSAFDYKIVSSDKKRKKSASGSRVRVPLADSAALLVNQYAGECVCHHHHS
jgi:hypothetical protein